MAAGVTGPNIWGDFETVLGHLKQMTVPTLKTVISGIVDQGAGTIGKSGRKSELQDRITRAMRLLQSDGRADRWLKARSVILQVRSTSEYDPTALQMYSLPQPSTSTPTIPRYNQPYTPTSTSTSGPYHASTSRPVITPVSPLRTSSGLTVPRWKPSPFHRIDQPVSAVQECPESANSTDRRSSRFNFYINQDQFDKLTGPRSSPRYQLRLYCTTSQYYVPIGTSFRNTPCPIEFPPTCEVRINQKSLTNANFRGIKKKAGTAPPADITELCNLMAPNAGTQVEMVYVNSNQPQANKAKPIPQKYYLVVNLVEVTTVDELVNQLQRRIQSKEKTLENLRTHQVDDDDVQVGPTRLSLRDPLTYTRLRLPCRATSCVHVQCFDATQWYTMMEQTTTWLCPICDRVLDVDELVIDDYVADILRQVPEDTDDVMVEASGEWHTEDNKYGSPAWMASHGTLAPISVLPLTTKSEGSSPLSTKVNSGDDVITIGDSTDSEEEQVKRELSPPHQQRPPSIAQVDSDHPAPAPSGPVIIDLTISDSDDEGVVPPNPPPARRPPPPMSILGKRKLGNDVEFTPSTSRRLSDAAPPYRSPHGGEETYRSHHERHLSGNTVTSNSSYSMPLHSPTSAMVPLGQSNGPSFHYANGNPISSSTAVSPPGHHSPPHWSQPAPARPPPVPFQLPPASTLLSGLPNPPLTSPLGRSPSESHLRLHPEHSSRPSYDQDHRHPSNGASSSTSRYAEWGLHH